VIARWVVKEIVREARGCPSPKLTVAPSRFQIAVPSEFVVTLSQGAH
jgi:hypothetical protein